MNKFTRFFKEKWLSYTIATCSAVALYMLLSHLGNIADAIGEFFGYLSSVITGIVLAYIMSPLVEKIKKTILKNIKNDRTRNIFGVIIATLIVIAVFAAIMIVLIPQIFESFKVLLSNMDSYVKSGKGLVKDLIDFASKYNIDLSDMKDITDQMLATITSKFSTSLTSILNASFNFGIAIVNILISTILALYFLFDRQRITEFARRIMHALFSDKKYNSMASYWRRCNKILIDYVSCSIIDGLLVGLVNAILMNIFGMPYVIIISVVVGVTNLAPTFGPIAGGAIGAFILVLVNPIQALIFIIFTIAIQIVDGYIVKPRLYGETLGIPGVWVLVSIIIGGKMFNVIGILLAIPFAAIVAFTVSDFLQKRENKKALLSVGKEKFQDNFLKNLQDSDDEEADDSEKDKSEKDKSKKDKSEKDKSEKDKSEKDKTEKDKSEKRQV